MIALDSNILVYAHRLDSPFNRPAFELMADLAGGPARWAIPWPCIHEFYSVVTNLRMRRDPTPPAAAWAQLDAWLAAPGVALLGEARTHLDHLRALTVGAQTVGGQVHDARIAAICLSHGVSELITMDRDFSRFPQLRTRSLLG
ncbi:MAG: type II toxin-antitoxin system VapC family toxin [Jatrophihabitantaceae bacterium]